jgi:hypothetical protein
MKKFLAIALVLFGTTAMACPDLAGTYMCPSYDENGNDIIVETTIAQSVDASGITNYEFITPDDSFAWPADGALSEFNFKDDESGSDMTIGLSLTCGSNTLTQFTSVNEVEVSGQVNYMSVTSVMSKDASGNLAKDETFVYEGQTFQQPSVCTKK